MDAPLSLLAWQRYDAVERLLPADVRTVLEVGAGLGSLGARLARRFEYTGLEPDRLSFEVAAERVGSAGRVLCVRVEDLEAGSAYDLVCAFEVLEHCEDDGAALATWLRHVRPGGYLLVSVPFRRDRFGPWDKRAGHYRRYDRRDVVEKLTGAGLQSVETIAYGFPLGSATEVARNAIARLERSRRTMDERTAASGRSLQPPSWAGGATRLASAPFRHLQRPFASANLGPGVVARGQLPAAQEGLAR